MSELCDVFLHIGTMKSGTSYLQAVLRRNEQRLRDDGILAKARLMAAMGDARGRTGDKWPREYRGEWAKLLTELREWPGRAAVLSQEFLAAASEQEVERVVSGLADHRLTIVITARDLARNIPSHWQTTVRSGSSISFDDFADAVVAPSGSADAEKLAEKFWRSHDLARIVSTWASATGPENVAIVTIPQPAGGRDVLWRRFAQAVGLEADRYDASPDANANVSLSYSQSELLRQVNTHLPNRINPLEYRALVWRLLASKLLQKATAKDVVSDRPRLAAAHQAALVELAPSILSEVASSGVSVVGDLQDLELPPPGPGTPVAPTVPTEPVPAFAAIVIAKLLARIADLERRATLDEGALAIEEPEQAERQLKRRLKRKAKRKAKRQAKRKARRAESESEPE